MTVDAITRTFMAELRAVEEGHQARRRQADDPTVYVVVSDLNPDDWKYHVRVTAGGVFTGPPDETTGCRPSVAAPQFTCDDAQVQRLAGQPRVTHPGLTACKHAAKVARRLEREGLIVWHDSLGWIEAPDVSLAVALRPPRRSTVPDADLFDL